MQTHKHFSIKKYFFPIAAIWSALCIVLALVVSADTSGTLTLADGSIGLSFSGDANNAWTASSTTITGSVTSIKDGMCTTSYKSTLTIANNKTTAATLSFSYTVTLSSGNIKVDGTAVTAGSNFSKELAVGASVTVYIESGSTSSATKIVLSDVKLVASNTATTTFQPAENGSYTVDGEIVSEVRSITKDSTIAYELVATPASNYKFIGWYDVTNGKWLSTKPSDSLNVEADCIITAKFADVSTAIFETGAQVFDDLSQAVGYAVSNSTGQVTLISSGVISGSYTIPSGITLLIPFDGAYTLYTTSPGYVVDGKVSSQSAYKTLTLQSGSSIVVDGAISIGGKHVASSAGVCCAPTGAYGLIKMQENSTIILNGGSNLYAWGYINGSGSVIANSGATVYEYFQVTDWRGGSATFSILGNSQKVFPFSQYYIQNIEVPLTLYYGAKEITHFSVTASSATNSIEIPFIGTNSLFSMNSADSSFTKRYIPESDRIEYTTTGNVQTNAISLKISIYTLNSKDYVLPVSNNITLNILSGTVTVNKDIGLLPGLMVNIEEGATLKVSSGASAYVYDDAEWSTSYVWTSKAPGIVSVPYSPSGKGSRTISDAKIDVNGTLAVEGSLYTTKTGADICSSKGTGIYIQGNAPGGATVTYQYDQKNKKYPEISITPAQLHNANGSYTTTSDKSAGTTIYYFAGRWGGVTVAFDANGGSGAMASQAYDGSPSMTDTTLPDSTFAPPDSHVFAGWNTAKDGSGTSCKAGDEVAKALADAIAALGSDNTITLYAQWEEVSTGSVTISWGALHYEYTPASYQWNPEEGKLRYEKVTDSYWTAKDDGQTHDLETPGYIQVASEGIAVRAALSFTKAADLTWPVMKFYLDQNGTLETSARTEFSVEADTSVLIKARLTGDPDSGGSLSAATVGSITITLSRQE